MKVSHSRILRPVLLLCLSLVTGCTSHLQQKENFLREAGFRPVTPSTPVQVAKVNSLPQGKITKVHRRGKTLYVLADAKNHLLLVGDDAKLEQYQQILYTKQVDPAIESRAFDKAVEYDDFGWGGMCDPFFGPMIY
jgi:hypothetical protein